MLLLSIKRVVSLGGTPVELLAGDHVLALILPYIHAGGQSPFRIRVPLQPHSVPIHGIDISEMRSSSGRPSLIRAVVKASAFVATLFVVALAVEYRMQMFL